MSQEIEKLSEIKPLGLFDLVDRILDKGLVIDAYVSVTVIGIELLVIRARIVVASIETFLRYASAMGLYGEPGGTIQRALREERGERPQQQQPLQGLTQSLQGLTGGLLGGRQQPQQQQPQQQQPQQQQQQIEQLQQLIQQLQRPLAQLPQQRPQQTQQRPPQQ
jgi:gas vesicle structural protein